MANGRTSNAEVSCACIRSLTINIASAVAIDIHKSHYCTALKLLVFIRADTEKYMNNLIMGRVDNIFQRLGSDVSHIIISNDISPFIDSSFFYLTGISSGIFEESFAVASRDGDVTVITGTLEAESAKESKLDVRVVTGNDSYKKALAEVLGKHKKIGINYGGSTLGGYMRIKKWLKEGRFIDASLAIEKARMVKDGHEIKMIRRAAEISSAAFYPIKEAIKEA